MAGYCFRYKNKMVSPISGIGNTEYVFLVIRTNDLDTKLDYALMDWTSKIKEKFTVA